MIESLESRVLFDALPLAAARPGAGNTGPTGALAKWIGSNTISTPNAVIDGYKFRGQVTIGAKNVTIENFSLNAAGDTYGVDVLPGASVTLLDGAVTNANGAAVYGANWTARRLNVHDLGSDAFKMGGNCTLDSSWIHQIGDAPGAHADGVQIDNGSGNAITADFFDTPFWSQSKDGTVYRCNSCIFANDYLYGSQYLSGTQIVGNTFRGGNYSLYLLQQTDTTVSGNVFLGGQQFGILDGDAAGWSGNVDAAGKHV